MLHLVSQRFVAGCCSPSAQHVLYKVHSLPETIQSHQRSHVFLAPIDNQINCNLLLFLLFLLLHLFTLSPILLQQKLCSQTFQIQIGATLFQLLLAQFLLALKKLSNVASCGQHLFKGTRFLKTYQFSLESLEFGQIWARSIFTATLLLLRFGVSLCSFELGV